MTSSEQHDRLVREQFRIQASAFDQQVGAHGYDHVLTWILGLLELDDSLSVLDVAAGTGLVARALAPHVGKVVALDATPEMLEEGGQQAQVAGLANLEFKQGDAQRLPYPDGSFDLVTCRLGMHHFFDSAIQAKEMARVCRPGGEVAIIDITSSEEPAAVPSGGGSGLFVWGYLRDGWSRVAASAELESIMTQLDAQVGELDAHRLRGGQKSERTRSSYVY